MRRRYIVPVWICASIPLVALLVFLLRPTPKARYEVTFLPDLNGVRVHAHAINNQGQIVGSLRLKNEPNPFAVVLTPMAEVRR